MGTCPLVNQTRREEQRGDANRRSDHRRAGAAVRCRRAGAACRRAECPDQPGRHHGGRLRQGGPVPALRRLRRVPRRARARPDRPAGRQAAALRDSAGRGTVASNLAGALTQLFGSVAVAVVALIISRDELRARLREARPAGVPLLTEATAMVASYLAAERDLGRIAEDADIDTLAPMLIGSGHLLFAGRDDGGPRRRHRRESRQDGTRRRTEVTLPEVSATGQAPWSRL